MKRKAPPRTGEEALETTLDCALDGARDGMREEQAEETALVATDEMAQLADEFFR